jgi:hypothetical protein
MGPLEGDEVEVDYSQLEEDSKSPDFSLEPLSKRKYDEGWNDAWEQAAVMADCSGGCRGSCRGSQLAAKFRAMIRKSEADEVPEV